MSNGQAQRAYKVLKIDELHRMSDTSGIESYYRLTIKTRGGTTLQINVEERDFKAEKTAPILKEKAEEADKILSL